MCGRWGREGQPAESRGQTETIGVVLILSMTLIGATVALALGASALGDARIGSQEEGIQNAMAQLDSRSAMVALGDSSAQHVPLVRGSYRVDPDAGWINVSHHNYSGSGDNEVIYNNSLGAFVYERDDETIAYQGGGVWRSAGGGSTMVSPPEFHYRSATLTLPVIRVLGSDSASGEVTAKVTAEPSIHRIYPNETTYDDGSPYSNPVSAGNVTVTIHSEYYQAWAAYFETRSDGEITVYHSNQTVEVFLVTPTTLGEFDMPNEGNGVVVQDLGEDHPINDFKVTLQGDPHFQEMHWSFYAEEDGQEVEIHIYSPGKCSGGGGGSYDDDLSIGIYYFNGTGGYHGWQNSSVDHTETNAVDIDCSTNQMHVDFMQPLPLEYKTIDVQTGDSGWHFSSEITDNDVDDPGNLVSHSTVHGELTYDANAGHTRGMGFLVNHYLQIVGPSMELKVSDGPGGSSRIDEGSSAGTLDYDSGGGNRFITFLHITENRVTVELE